MATGDKRHDLIDAHAVFRAVDVELAEFLLQENLHVWGHRLGVINLRIRRHIDFRGRQESAAMGRGVSTGFANLVKQFTAMQLENR